MTDDLHILEVKNVMEYVRHSLYSILDELDGEKTLVWDTRDELMRRINLFTGARELSEHHVRTHLRLNHFRVCFTPYVVFLLTASVKSLDDLCAFLDKCEENTDTLYIAVFIPEASFGVREQLKERNGGKYWERLESVKEVPLWWLPTDGHCLTLNEPELSSRLLINGDWTYLHRCASALNEFLTLIAGKCSLYSKGEWSQRICKMVMGTKKAFNDEIPPCRRIHVNRIIVIDRWLDPLTPLLTQLTYSGLLDELFSINFDSIKVPQADFNQSENTDPAIMKEILLKDEIFYKIRYVHREFWGSELRRIAHDIDQEEAKIKDIGNHSLAECKVLMKKLPETMQRKQYRDVYYRLAEMMMQHDSSLAELVRNEQELLYSSEKPQQHVLSWLSYNDSDHTLRFIEDAILDAVDLTRVLRLIAIQSLVSDGLKPGVLGIYRRLIWQSYGTEAVNMLIKMQKMGLILEKNVPLAGNLKCEYPVFSFQTARKKYELLVQREEEVDKALLIHGDRLHWTDWIKHGQLETIDNRKTAVFIVGGVTRSEVALIQQIPNVSLVMTTAIITGKSLLENMTRI